MLTTPDEVIDRLGGTAEVARRFGMRPTTVSEWRKGLPTKTMVALIEALIQDGVQPDEISLDLWPKMLRPAPATDGGRA